MTLTTSTPIFRMFDVQMARGFYVDWLGFEIVFEHRFGDDYPLYMGLARDHITLHLSEHHGDATPGSAVRIEVSDIAAFHADLTTRPYRYARPGINTQPWGCREVSVTDPFGNRLVFFENDPPQAGGRPQSP